MSTADDAVWFRDQLAALGHTQSSLAREMAALGDPRDPKVILRSINRMATGGSGVSGEMRVILRMMRDAQQKALQQSETATA